MFTPQLNVVVGFAQKWADHLAKTGSFQHNQDRNFEKQTLGENIAMKWTSNNDAFTGDVISIHALYVININDDRILF